jgi:hypothetical protein
MLLGVAFWCFFNKRLDVSEEVINYAIKHGMKMGKGTGVEGLSRIMMSPSLLATFAWISYKLGGPSRPWLRWVPAFMGGTPKNFQAHLQVLHCLLRRHLTGKKDQYKKIFASQARRQRSNPLFAYAAGDAIKARRLLSDECLWPQDRLPWRMDRKSPWVLERDWGDDWKPAPDNMNIEHTGADFMFCYWLVRENI